MKSLKRFEEFERERIVRKRTPDLPRAQALIKESEKRKKFLEQMQNKDRKSVV